MDEVTEKEIKEAMGLIYYNRSRMRRLDSHLMEVSNSLLRAENKLRNLLNKSKVKIERIETEKDKIIKEARTFDFVCEKCSDKWCHVRITCLDSRFEAKKCMVYGSHMEACFNEIGSHVK